MKDYSLKINGNQYDISIEDVNEESTMANVTVNGVAYEVEIVGEQASKMKKPQVVPAPKAAGLSVTPTTAGRLPLPKLHRLLPAVPVCR